MPDPHRGHSTSSMSSQRGCSLPRIASQHRDAAAGHVLTQGGIDADVRVLRRPGIAVVSEPATELVGLTHVHAGPFPVGRHERHAAQAGLRRQRREHHLAVGRDDDRPGGPPGEARAKVDIQLIGHGPERYGRLRQVKA